MTQQVVRIWEDTLGVHGWIGLWWEGAQHAQELAGQFRCADVRTRSGYAVCTVPAPHQDWASVLTRLDRYRVARLPPQRRDPRVLDGVSIAIEHRDGRRYRAYSYSNPGGDGTDADETSAAKILRELQRLPARGPR